MLKMISPSSDVSREGFYSLMFYISINQCLRMEKFFLDKREKGFSPVHRFKLKTENNELTNLR